MRTDFLFAQPSFWTGVASLFDFGGALDQYNEAATPEEADWIALAMDWGMVGQDMRDAFEQFRKDHPELAAVA